MRSTSHHPNRNRPPGTAAAPHIAELLLLLQRHRSSVATAIAALERFQADTRQIADAMQRVWEPNPARAATLELAHALESMPKSKNGKKGK